MQEVVAQSQIEELIPPELQEVVHYIKEKLSPYRRAHIFRVVYYSSRLAQRFYPGKVEVEQKAKIAALLHDITKEEKKEFHLELFERHGLLAEYKDIPGPVMHSKSAALFAREKFGIWDEEVAEACACHTTGKAGMGVVAQIVFAADMMGSLSEEEIKQKENLSLKELCLEKLIYSLKSVLEKKGRIHPDSWLYYDFLLRS
ncbi:MAG: HD domain-containing protein [Leptospiraceae bacterium]|nr:HD domain-containing protein [Leptospiraceae bacterium]MDW8307275.1 HD domain-containing protein [Leptospiraceae bacterium]